MYQLKMKRFPLKGLNFFSMKVSIQIYFQKNKGPSSAFAASTNMHGESVGALPEPFPKRRHWDLGGACAIGISTTGEGQISAIEIHLCGAKTCFLDAIAHFNSAARKIQLNLQSVQGFGDYRINYQQ
jgi:hypothetical protein